MAAVATPTTVEEYIDSFPTETKDVLSQIRTTIAAALPGSGETIRYGMPAVMSDDRYVVHYAGWKRHIGMYPIPVMSAEIEAEVAPLRAAKDTLRLPLDKPIPYDLIARLVVGIERLRATERSASQAG